MTRKHASFPLLTIFLMILSALSLTAKTKTTGESPVLRIPKMTRKPVIDGKIDKDEWSGASAVTGLSSYRFQDMYPQTMQTVWYLGYDDNNLYLAMHGTIPDGVFFKADYKSADANDNEHSVIFGDHVEIQLTPHEAKRANRRGFGFYKLCANVHGIYSDYWHFNDVAGSEMVWSSNCKLKSSFDNNNWWLEIAWPLNSMKSAEGGNIKRADNLELIMQLVRSGFCSGYSYGGLVPATWREFDRFYKLILDPEAPVMQFTRTGDLIYGNLDTMVKLKGKNGEKADVSLEVLNIDGKPVFSADKKVTLQPDNWSDIALKKAKLPIDYWTKEKDRQRCAYKLAVTSEGKTIFNIDVPFIGHSPDFDEKTYQGYINSRPKGNYKTRFAYYPINGKARLFLDLDVIGDIPKEIIKAPKLKVTIKDKTSGKTIKSWTLPIKDKMLSELVDIGPLNGEFDAVYELIGTNGKVVSTREHPFVRKKHVWENNTIGKEKVVLPPFRPIQFDGDALKTRCATFEFAKGGFPQKLTVMDKALIPAPVGIAGTINGKQESWSGSSLAFKKIKGKMFPSEFDKYRFFKKNCPKVKLADLKDTDGYEATIDGAGQIDGVNTTMNASLDYDGFYRVKLTFSPAGKPVKVDDLSLAIPLWQGADLLLSARNIPVATRLDQNKNGIVWQSTDNAAKPLGFKGSFVPYLAISDGQYAVQFRADSDQGWHLDDNKAAMTVTMKDGQPTLNLNVVNKPLELSKPRTIEFSLMPLPAQPPVDNWRHTVWAGYEKYGHYAFGWRKYGTGADNYYFPTDEDYRLLGQCFLSEKQWGPRAKASKNGPVLIYSSVIAIGAPLPDMDSYKGQWYGDSNISFNRGDSRVKDKMKNMTGRYVWDKSECFSEARPINYDESVNDNYMWFHKKLAELADVNGSMWDNQETCHFASPDTGTFGYYRDDGHLQPTYNMFTRRSLMKRLYTMGWLAGKPPLYFHKFSGQLPFSTLARGIEGCFYTYSLDGTAFDQLGPGDGYAYLNIFRGSEATPMRIDTHMHRPVGGGTFFDTLARSYLAVGLLHDIAIPKVRQNPAVSQILDRIDQFVGLLDPEKQATFIPYWRNQDVVRLIQWEKRKDGKMSYKFVQPQDVQVSIYHSQKDPKKALIWIVNGGDKPAHYGLWFDSAKLLGKPCQELVNLENGITMKHQLHGLLPAIAKDYKLRSNLWWNVSVPPKNFLALEAEVK